MSTVLAEMNWINSKERDRAFLVVGENAEEVKCAKGLPKLGDIHPDPDRGAATEFVVTPAGGGDRRWIVYVHYRKMPRADCAPTDFEITGDNAALTVGYSVRGAHTEAEALRVIYGTVPDLENLQIVRTEGDPDGKGGWYIRVTYKKAKEDVGSTTVMEVTSISEPDNERVFRVYGYKNIGKYSKIIGSIGIPDFGEEHPTDQNLIVDTKQVCSDFTPEYYTVRVVYKKKEAKTIWKEPELKPLTKKEIMDLLMRGGEVEVSDGVHNQGSYRMSRNGAVQFRISPCRWWVEISSIDNGICADNVYYEHKPAGTHPAFLAEDHECA